MIGWNGSCRCFFCGQLVDDGGIIEFEGSKVWIGIVCGCDDDLDKSIKIREDRLNEHE